MTSKQLNNLKIGDYVKVKSPCKNKKTKNADCIWKVLSIYRTEYLARSLFTHKEIIKTRYYVKCELVEGVYYMYNESVDSKLKEQGFIYDWPQKALNIVT